MSRTRLSKISMTPQGAWDSTTEYKRLDVVSNAGASWLAKQDNVGVTPVEGENWMNLVNITKDSVVDALGYTPEKDYGDYELIETITLTEDTDQISRTAEPNGTAYNLLKVVVTVTLPKGTAQTEGYIKYYASGGVTSCYINGTMNSNYFQRYTSWVDASSGLLYAGSCALTLGYGSTVDSIEVDPSIYRQSGSVWMVTSGVKRIYFAKGTNNNFKAGTVIKIYAVRA